MDRSGWLHFAQCFVGVVVVIAAIVVGFGAIHYEFEHVSTTDEPENWETPLHSYDDYSAEEQRMIRRAIDGERFVFERAEPMPSTGDPAATGEMMVRYEGSYHTFDRRQFFDASSTPGIAATLVALVGVLLVADAIRRHHFPDYRPWERVGRVG